VDRYLAISEAVREASLSGTGQPPQDIEVVPTFIPDDVVEEGRRAGRPDFLPPHDDYILFVGALGAHKGLPVLLEAYQGLQEKAPLVVIGTDRHDTPERFPDGVTVVHNAPHAQVMAAWAHCLVGVVPSVWPEPFGQVAIEAQASGRPVVASAIGGLRDAVADGETGLLVPPGDAQGLREALCMLLRDPQLRARMGEAGRVRARRFMASAVTDRIEQIYAEVLAGQCPASDQ
jgi:glycosyltransferase involved in cell wall biosynthesis